MPLKGQNPSVYYYHARASEGFEPGLVAHAVTQHWEVQLKREDCLEVKASLGYYI